MPQRDEWSWRVAVQVVALAIGLVAVWGVCLGWLP